mmetsp:Transcript_102422/g.285427  ORF Transcript_102422/g.285427 Transcript_102422/m.285427 type:complete len:783 (+) Transcript_102422:70-2418(+)
MEDAGPALQERCSLTACEVAAALDKVEERFGDMRWASGILHSWAAAGQTLLTGQALSPEVVNAAVEARLKPKAPAKGSPQRCEPDGLNGRLPATPLTKRTQELIATAKRARTASHEELRQTRQQQGLQVRELTRGRLAEVLGEIDGHMREVVGRVGPDALERWRTAPADCDRRELYMQLVHAAQESEVPVPQDLCAELLPHQVEGLEWLASLYANNLHGILADEMGLGKTIQTITLLLYLQEHKGNLGPHLVVAPKSTLSNWQAEFMRFAPSYAAHVLTGDHDQREAELKALRSDMALGRPIACITNYEQVYRNEWVMKGEWQVIVVDEGHRLKNPETVLHNAMTQIRCRMRLLLTGTPLQNSVNELWALLHYLLPELFTYTVDFKKWFSRPYREIPGLNEFEVQLDPEQEQQVVERMHALLAPFLLQRLKSEVLTDRLPPRVEVTLYVPLSAWQQVAYRDFERRTIRLLADGGSVSSEQVNNAFMQLRKIVLHPYLFQEGYAQDQELYRTSGKLEALDRLLLKLLRFEHKVLIFSQFTNVLDILEAFLQWRGIASVRLDGQVPHEQRSVRIERFNTDPALHVFLLSTRAGGLGLNLQAADTVVLFDLDWNPQNDKQAIARVHRVGQTREVRVIRLVTQSAVERHMERRCLEKLELERKVMGAGMFRRQATGEQRSQALQSVLGLAEDAAPLTGGEGTGAATTGACTAANPAGSDSLTSPEELSRRLARSAEELTAFAAMDAELLGPQVCTDGTAQRLVRCGRLMSLENVPRGFAGTCDDST